MLSTFCHISEYGEDAYRKLPALIAISGTLNLWAPSSVWLRLSGIGDKQFIALVEAGYVRVLARHNWLNERSAREAAAANWGPAAWTPSIDDCLKGLLKDGSDNVIVAPPERGYVAAQELADEDPAVARAIYEAYTSENSQWDIPVGVLQSVERGGGSPSAIVQGVLRDVLNHADAFRLSNAKRPMFLSPNPQSLFIRQVIRILDKAHDNLEVETPEKAGYVTSDYDVEQLAHQLFNLVYAWDEHSLNRDLIGFMNGPGQAALSSWYDQLLCDIQEDGCSNLDGIVARRLERDMRQHGVGGAKSARAIQALSESAGVASLATAIVATGFTGLGPDLGSAFSIASLGTAAFSSGLGALQRIGWIKPGYEGTQWPFFYMFGSEATEVRRQQALDILSGLR